MMLPRRTTCAQRSIDLPEDVLARIVGHLDQLKDRVYAVSCNRQLAALGKSCTRLWEEVEFPKGFNPYTVAVWLAAKRSIVRKADLCRFSAEDATYLLAVLAGGATEELRIRLNGQNIFNPSVVQLPRLRKLSITGGYDSGLSLQGSFTHLCHLSSLHLSEVSRCTEESLSLRGLTELQDLSCVAHNRCFGPSLGLSWMWPGTALSQATRLTSLALGLASAVFPVEALLPALPALEQLSVSGRAASQLARAGNWTGLTQLKKLTLSHAWHGGEPLDVVPVVRLPQLEVLDISGCKLQHLPQLGLGMPILVRLQRLTVKDAWLADNRAWLDRLPFVKVLHLTGEPYGSSACYTHWQMLLESLAHSLPSLESLEIDACKTKSSTLNGGFPRDSFKRLIAKRPNLHVVSPGCK